jgi:hypothetical protein
MRQTKNIEKSIGSRLWSGCLSSTKIIALETRNGPNTPEMRAKRFQELDVIFCVMFFLALNFAPYFKHPQF